MFIGIKEFITTLLVRIVAEKMLGRSEKKPKKGSGGASEIKKYANDAGDEIWEIDMNADKSNWRRIK